MEKLNEMEMDRKMDRPGEPHLEIAGFRLWIRRRQYPDSDEYWDANWLDVSARCEAHGASVRVEGPVLMAPDVERFLRECEALHEYLTGAATLDSAEPNLRVRLSADGRAGHLALAVRITPDAAMQRHEFTFALDQTYLPAVISQCRAILREYPVRGHP